MVCPGVSRARRKVVAVAESEFDDMGPVLEGTLVEPGAPAGFHFVLRGPRPDGLDERRPMVIMDM